MRLFGSFSEPRSVPNPGMTEGRFNPRSAPTPGGVTGVQPWAVPSSFKKGGKVRKTGLAKVHKGETVIPKRGVTRVMGGRPKPKGKTTKRAKVKKVMHEFGKGKLRSGSKQGPVVTNPKQAVAISLSSAGLSNKK